MSEKEHDFVVCPIVPENGTNGNPKSAGDVVACVRAAFDSGKTKSVEFRRHQLKKLLCMLEENSDEFVKVLQEDLGRPKLESITYDIDLAANEIRRILKNLDDWVKPTYPSKSFAFILDTVKIVNDPYGVVLILGSWNYPIAVVLQPLAGAISAGNCAVIKLSEISVATSNLISKLLPKYLDASCYQVYGGGPEETNILLQQRFDYIFFTGSTKVGKIVHNAASKYLTPTSLELGGKSPVYIDNTVDINLTVRRIMWGKYINSGQTCIAPDYILCSEEIQSKFLPIAKQVLKEWCGDDIKASPDFSRIISEQHYNRLVGFLSDKNQIAIGGKVDSTQRFIEPTILVNVSPNHPVMQEEIFGPILPIVTVKNMHEACAFINAREKPLTIYIFSKERSVKDFILSKTSSGTAVVNDTMIQFGALMVPFGGVGSSGMGKYHGKDSFDTFVHKKTVIDKGLNPLVEKTIAIRYPPYTKTKLNLLRLALLERGTLCFGWCKYLLVFVFGIVFMICLQLIYYKVTNKYLI